MNTKSQNRPKNFSCGTRGDELMAGIMHDQDEKEPILLDDYFLNTKEALKLSKWLLAAVKYCEKRTKNENSKRPSNS